MDREMRKEEWRRMWRELSEGWPSRLLIVTWAAALMFVVGMAAGSVLDWLSREQGQKVLPLACGEEGEKPMLDVVFIDQRELYPTGCESVTAVMALRYAGAVLEVEEFIDNYLPQVEAPQEDGQGGYTAPVGPEEAFLGSPYSEDGWGCYAPVIASAIERFAVERRPELKVEDLTGCTLEELVEEGLGQGRPVILWATMGMAEPRARYTIERTGTKGSFEWISPEHCLLLVGADGENYYFNDPLEGKAVPYPKAAVEQAYEALGRQALVIE